MRKLLILPVLVLALLLTAGCASQTANGQDAVQTNQVNMPPSYNFSPEVIQVTVGETVTWTNNDHFTHDVHLMGGLDWVSQPLHPGESTSYTFTKAGTFPYICDFHSQDMKGQVIVVDK